MDKKTKVLALVAHDNMKRDLAEWVDWNSRKLSRHHLVCTGTTGKMVEKTLRDHKEEHEDDEPKPELRITLLKSGPLGGDQQLGSLIADGKIVTITSDAYYYISGGYILGLPFPMYIAAVILVLALLITKKTAFGLAVEAIGINSDSARLAGIKVERNTWLIYIFCGFCAALAGLIESAGIKGADCNNCGLMIEMDGILAVAIGGTSLSGGRFSIVSSVIGALVVQTITTTILAFGIAPEVIRVFKAVIVIVICLAQSPAFLAKLRGVFAKKKAVSNG